MCRAYFWLFVVVAGLNVSRAGNPFQIKIIDQASGWPVPLVQLTTTHQVTFVSDNAGIIAIDLPEVMGKETWFQVEGHGYEVPKDGFGARGVRLVPTPGETAFIRVNRTILAERLGRITGGGIFAESQKVGAERNWKETGVFGCDSVQTVMHRGSLFWFWGDTTILRYPLGIFDGSGATTDQFPLEKYQPPIHLRYKIISDPKERPTGVAAMPGPGPTWLTACVDLPDKTGAPHLVASYLKIRGHLDAYEKGLCEWDEKAHCFQHLQTVWRKDEAQKAVAVPEGHAVMWKDSEGRNWAFFGNPFPALRCPATFESWQDQGTWEKLHVPELLHSRNEQEAVTPHSGSIAWHPWNKRWVCVFTQKFGKPSSLGEVWYAEGATPTGPWGEAIKILSHNNYTFYNPVIHGEWFSEKSPELLFEGTYSAEFADHAHPTPRYDYNQILYRLDVRALKSLIGRSRMRSGLTGPLPQRPEPVK
jgi:hypothetical protein